MRYRARSLALSTLLATFLASSANAVNLFVNQASTGATHDGATWATAYLTVDEALLAARPGEAVWVAKGVYTIGATVPAGVSLYGSFAGYESDIRNRAGGPQSTTLHARQAGFPIVTIAKGAGPDTVFNGFLVESLGSETNITFVAASPTITSNIFTRKAFYYSAQLTPNDLLFCADASPLIAGNIFSGASVHAIDCGNGNPIILNNTIVGNEGGGIVLYAYSRGWIANNLLVRNSVGIWSNNPELTVVRNNCFYQNASSDYAGPYGNLPAEGAAPGGLPVFGNFVADPHFAAAALGNYHIQPDSPCVNAANAADSMFGLDIDFQSLDPRTNRLDIGADESNGKVWHILPTVVRVSTTGDDANDGASWATAKRTVGAAADAIGLTGGEVWVAEGEYVDDASSIRMGRIVVADYVALYGGFAGTETSRDARDWKAHVTTLANHQRSNGVIVSSAGRGTSRVDGFTIKAARGPGLSGGIGISLKLGSPVIANNVITGEGQDTVLINGENASPLITRCILTDCKSTYVPIVLNGMCPIVSNAVITNVASSNGPAINVSLCRTFILKDCILDGNASASNSPLFQRAFMDMRITNNTFVNNQGYVYYRPQFAPSVSANNIFAFNTPNVSTPLPASPQLRNNCIYPAGALAVRDSNGNLAMDPKFVDAEHGDYRLADQSPCSDAGDNTLVLPGDLDLDDGPRIRGRRVDMGAFESAFAAPSPNFLEVLNALKIAGGLRDATSDDMAWLNTNPEDGTIDVSDTIALLRQLHEPTGTH